ncbi:MAG TPA: response regulator [Thermoanaerobaculia bacterium]|nr:response regulator [Thermoanaerobaculia bacterium]
MPGDVIRARVLVADDDQSIRQLLCTIVRREHFDVDTVADGAEAIAKLKEHEYAVILLDLMMPRVSGFEVINYLRQHPPAVKPVVLVITAYADQRFKEVDSTIVAGVLRKPFEIADLGGIVRLCIKGYDAELTERLYSSNDRSIRSFAQQQIHGRRGSRDGNEMPN